MYEDKKLKHLPSLFWEVFVSERNKLNPEVDSEHGEFLSLRAASDYVNNFFSKDQFVRMINKDIVRVNSNKKIYKNDLELLKGCIIAIQVLKDKKLYVMKKDGLGKKLAYIYHIVDSEQNPAFVGDRDLQMLLEYTSTPEFTSFQKAWNTTREKTENKATQD
jgi:hypothetical protein